MSDDAVAPFEVADVGPDGFEGLAGVGGLGIGQDVGGAGVLAAADEARIVIPSKNLAGVHFLLDFGN